MPLSRRVDEKGRVTIPKEFRERLGLEPGEEIEMEVTDDDILLHPKVSRETFKEAMKGCVNEETAKSGPIDPEELKKDWTHDLPL